MLAGVIIAAIKLPAWRRTRRRDEMYQLAQHLGWGFSPDRDATHESVYHLEIFTRGSGSAAFNTLTGTLKLQGRQIPIQMGDFTYSLRTSSAKGTVSTRYVFSYLLVQQPIAHAADLVIRSERLGDKVAGFLGWEDIDFESVQFSDMFHVKSRDRRFAYDLLHPRMMDLFLSAKPPGLLIEGGHVCISDGQSTWGPRVFVALLPWLQEFFDLWPEHLIRRLRNAQRTTGE